MKASKTREPQLGKARAVFYHRDSGGKHLSTPGEYVRWAGSVAKTKGLLFDGTPEGINTMIANGITALGGMYLDWDVKGNQLVRKGLNQLFETLEKNEDITHVFIARRDRLARPDEIAEGMALENRFRRDLQVTLVYQNQEYKPLKPGEKISFAEFITGGHDFDRAEQDRRDLAIKMLNSQPGRALNGFMTGGRAPYGFRRWLVGPDGVPVQPLADHETIRRAGFHVVPMPATDGSFETRIKILQMLQTMPATQIENHFNELNALEMVIPPPDYGRTRVDGGIRHANSGLWRATTIANIGRHPINKALLPYAQRSMGDKQRYSPNGPRDLKYEDFRSDGKPKVIRNPDDQIITGPCKFKPLLDEESLAKLQVTMDRRSGTQRGKPRSRTPSKNPLGGRIFDIACTWPMYRAPYKDSFRYVCGLYYQTHAKVCGHNHVDGPTAVSFAVNTVRQMVLAPTRIEKIRQRLHEIAQHEQDGGGQQGSDLSTKEAELRIVLQKIETASTNMALAQSPEQFKAITNVFDNLKRRQETLHAEIATIEKSSVGTNIESEVNSAMALLQSVADMSSAAQGDLAAAKSLFDLLNIRLFFSFRDDFWGKRKVRKIASGTLCIGSQPSPIEVYSGPTSRREVNKQLHLLNKPAADIESLADTNVSLPPREGDSLGNVNRGDKI